MRGVVERVEDGDKEKKKNLRSNRRSKQHSSASGTACSSVNEVRGEASESLRNGSKIKNLAPSMIYSSAKQQGLDTHTLNEPNITRASNVAFSSMPTMHIPDLDVRNIENQHLFPTNHGGRMFSLSCPEPISCEGSPGSCTNKVLLPSHQIEGYPQSKSFAPHWSMETVDEALEKGDAFQAVFHGNAHNRFEVMDHGTDDSEVRQTGSFGRSSSAGSSLRRRSLSLPVTVPFQTDDDIESEIVSEAGDIGDRALHSSRHSESSSLRLSLDNGAVVPIPENFLLQPPEFWSHDPTASNTISPVLPLPEEILSPLSTDAVVRSEDKKQDKEKVLPESLEYISCLIHLAVFGILGVLTRYLLEELFGPSVADVTIDQSILYLDLPSNMVGSFLMGWWGVVFKGDISSVSDYLAIGLTTGYLGSLTTFSGWNQKMLDLVVEGRWVISVLGFLIGLFLAAYSIIFGVETARGFRFFLKRINPSCRSGISCFICNCRVDSYKRHLAVMVMSMLMLGFLWSVSGALVKEEFNSGSRGAWLWLACLVAPPGVWIRWFLARLNGRGIGRARFMKWVPFGTLLANVSAACIMAALSTLRKAVNTRTCDTFATAIQFGFLGCLSTVSTFIAEFNAMRESKHPWRAYAYAMITICTSLVLGILIYSVPVWAKGYN